MSEPIALEDLTLKQLMQLQCRFLSDILAQLIELNEAAEPATTECPHPEARRVDLSTFGDTNHWVCLDCKFEHKSVAMN